MPSYKLTYFNGRGRAEYARLVFAAAGVQYDDERVTDWPAGKADAPLGQLPYLTVDGVKLPQSMSIARFVARRHNLAGADDIAQAQADVVVDTVNDLLNAYGAKVYSVKEEEREKVKTEFIAKEGQDHLAKLEKLIGLYGSNGHAVGSSLTWADLAVFEISFTAKAISATSVDAFPHIQAVIKSVEADPKVGPYIKSRPHTHF